MREGGRERGGSDRGRGRERREREGRCAHGTAPVHAPSGSVGCRAHPSAQILLAPKVLLVQQENLEKGYDLLSLSILRASEIISYFIFFYSVLFLGILISTFCVKAACKVIYLQSEAK